MLKELGVIAGIAGIALGVLLILYRDVIRKNIFPTLTKDQGFKLLILILLLVWSIAIVGIGAWFFGKGDETEKNGEANKIIYQGYVEDSITKKPIKKAAIRLFLSDLEKQLYTDNEGQFKFILPPIQGTYEGRLSIEHAEYEPYEKYISLGAILPLEHLLMDKKNADGSTEPSSPDSLTDLAVSASGQSQVREEISKIKKDTDSSEEYPLKNKLWPNGSTLKVTFLDGDTALQNKVKAIAQEWIQYANIRFDFGAHRQPDVRISFREPGDWAYVGTDGRLIDQRSPTINMGSLNAQSPNDHLRFTVLREFGHALGLINENNSPNADIPWNIEKVYRVFSGAPYYMPPDAINDSILKKFNIPNYRKFDPQSVMMFSISKTLTDGKFEVGLNSNLSQGDKELITELYPKI